VSGKKVRVAIVGAGGIAETAHIPAYLSNEYSEVTAIVDSNDKQLKKITRKFKVKKTFSSVDDLLDSEEIDAMSICTPPNTHANIALKGLQHGVHILCEKPMATDIDDGKQMATLSKQNKLVLMVGFHRRFIQNYQNAKKHILNGSLGHVYYVEDQWIQPNPLYTYSKSTWFFKSGVGGVLFDTAPHIFDMMNYIFDDFPKSISAQGFAYFDHSVEDNCVFLLEYPGNRVGIGVASWLSSNYAENLTILGTAQNLRLSPNYFLRESSNEFHEIALFRAASKSLISAKFPSLPFARGSSANPYQLEINHFIDCIKSNTPSPESALNGLSVLMTTDAARISIEKGCRVKIPSPGQ
jgi:UDP-N-acetylglucosamine 3-dehydrogenase